MEVSVINKTIKFLGLLLLSFSVFAGGSDDDAYYENLDQELAAFEAQVAADIAAKEMMSEIQTEMQRQAALDAFQKKLADERAAAAASTAAYQSKLANDAKVQALIDELLVAKELDAFEAQLQAELDAREMMAEIEREMALAAFQQKLEDERAAAAAATAAYRDSLLAAELAAFEAQLAAELASQEMMAEIIAEMADAEVVGVIEDVVVTEAAHEACKYELGLSDSNIALFKASLADGTLFNVGPQLSTGTEFTANRWDAYATCVSNYVNPF